MQFDLKQAFTYFFQDKKLFQKLSWLYVIILLFFMPAILCCVNSSVLQITGMMGMLLIFPLFIVFAIYFGGYFALTVNRRIIKTESDLPEINDWKNCFNVGGKCFVGSLAWGFILQLIMYIVITFSVLFCTLFGAVLIPLLSAANSSFSTALLAILFILFGIIFIAIILAVTVLYIAMLIAVFSAFLTDLRVESFFDFGKIKHIVCINFKSLFKFVGWSLVLGLLFCLGSLILIVTIVGIVAIPLLYAFYILIFCDMEAQFIRHIFNIEQKEAING